MKDRVWDKDIPIELREAFVRSMYDLFAQFFAVEPLTPNGATTVYMWWDWLAYPFHMLQMDRMEGKSEAEILSRNHYWDALSEDAQRLRQVMFETLSRILQIDSPLCQIAAIHGLGHLFHPDTPKLLTSYMESRKEFPAQVAGYYESHNEYIMQIVRGESIL